MRRESLTEKKKAKGFYIKGFHYTVNVLIVSVLLSFVLLATIHNKLLHPGRTTYYASNGFFSAPIELTALDAPNESSIPLLADDPPEEMMARSLPENV